MNLKLIKVKIKWFTILGYYKVKQLIWCDLFHKNNICYGHCDACSRCGIGMDYLIEKSNAEKKND